MTAKHAHGTNNSLQKIIYFNWRHYNINVAGIINKYDLDERRRVNSFTTSAAISCGGRAFSWSQASQETGNLALPELYVARFGLRG